MKRWLTGLALLCTAVLLRPAPSFAGGCYCGIGCTATTISGSNCRLDTGGGCTTISGPRCAPVAASEDLAGTNVWTGTEADRGSLAAGETEVREGCANRLVARVYTQDEVESGRAATRRVVI